MASRSVSVVAFSALVVLTASVRAQTGGIAGMVYRDSLGHEIPGVEVSIPALQRRATANYLGAFRMSGLPAGKHLLQIRAVGFSPWRDTVVVVAGKETEREFILSPTATQLDSVRIVAAGTPQRIISPALRGFEERRKQGFGHFIAGEDLRKTDGRTLANLVISRIPGLHTVNEGMATYLSSGRNVSSSEGPVLGTSLPGGRRGAPPSSTGGRSAIKVRGCWVTLYLDGAKLYDASMTERDSTYRPPDMGRMDGSDLGGIEYYAGGATIPPQFNSTGSNCGTLLLWSRER